MLNFGLKTELRQELSTTPQQVLFSNLLQMPLLQLETELHQRMLDNPFLETIDEEEEGLIENTSTMEENPDIEEARQVEKEKVEEDSGDEIVLTEEPDSSQNEEVWESRQDDEDDHYVMRQQKDHSKEEIDRPDPASTTFIEKVLEQFRLLPLSEHDLEIGEYLIWNLRADGYLDPEIVEITADELDVTEEEVEKVLYCIQRLDPVGLGARNLRECLLVQLREIYPWEIDTIAILEEAFDDFANRRYEKLAERFDLPLEGVKVALDTLQKLNPKPGEGAAINNYVSPDLTVEKIDGDWIISLNDVNLPHLRINMNYRADILETAEKNPEKTKIKNYVKQKSDEAEWLVAAMQQRKDTMVRVMRSILEEQYEWFEHGNSHLKPLILRNIAERVNMDISTISRVTNGKYVDTPWGIHELKFFFSEKMQAASGEDVATTVIKNKLKEIIEGENKRNPVKDQELVRMLTDAGYPIARRTVAKYRSQMNIPTAKMRREIV